MEKEEQQSDPAVERGARRAREWVAREGGAPREPEEGEGGDAWRRGVERAKAYMRGGQFR